MRGVQCFQLIAAVSMIGAGHPLAQDIPADLLEDPHFREEFGINEVTSPSIRKIFEQLNALGKTDWSRYGRPIPKTQPEERSRLALSLGGLIAEGFFVIQSERVDKLEELGNALARRASALGTGAALGSHIKALMEFSQRSDWSGLREELARAQLQVQRELVRLRDVEAVHLISLGGWLRALEVVCAAASDPYSPPKAKFIRRVDVATYFCEELETLHPRTQDLPHIASLRQELETLRLLLSGDPELPLTPDALGKVRAVVAGMAKAAFAD